MRGRRVPTTAPFPAAGRELAKGAKEGGMYGTDGGTHKYVMKRKLYKRPFIL